LGEIAMKSNSVAPQAAPLRRLPGLAVGQLWFAAYGAVLFMAIDVSQAFSQGAGGQGGQPGAPAFSEPKFRDRMWEAGGPRLSELHQGKLVLGVQIVGNQTVSEHKILSHMQTRKDRYYDDKQLQMDIHELHGTELFTKIKADFVEYQEGVVVRLTFAERPTVTEVIFHGNTRIENRMLEKHCGISVGDPVNPFSVEMAQQRLLDLYQEKGMNQASVRVVEGNKKGDRRIYFEISEGPVERVWSINFIGNTLFSDAELKIKVSSRDARGGVTPYIGNVANKLKIEDDARALVALYRSLGYFNARADYRISYYDSGNFLDLTFVIDEGQQFRVRDISVVGNRFQPFTSDVLLAAMELKSGDAFNLGRMNRDTRRIRNDFYGREGFVFVDIVPQPVFLDEPGAQGMLDLVYKINEGDRYRAGEINVHIDGDASHTRNRVVLNMLGIREGQYIDLRELENSERRLKFSQLFETNPAMGEPPSIQIRRPDESYDMGGN
jgi:outer membrane protein insertion porin family